MGCPLIVVTGGIASGKTTVARVMAARGGCLLDADRIARSAYKDPCLRERVAAAFGGGVMTSSGMVSRKRLGRIVFPDKEAMERLNRIVKPFVKKTIGGMLREKAARERYIVLDAVLYFQYKFMFKAALSIQTRAGDNIRIARLIARDGLEADEAAMRIEGQKPLCAEWEKADITIDTSADLATVIRKAAGIRDEFLKREGILRKDHHE